MLVIRIRSGLKGSTRDIYPVTGTQVRPDDILSLIMQMLRKSGKPKSLHSIATTDVTTGEPAYASTPTSTHRKQRSDMRSEIDGGNLFRKMSFTWPQDFHAFGEPEHLRIGFGVS
jgi:hypothetical protein